MNTVEETVLLYVKDHPKCNANYILEQLKSKCPAITKIQINKILYDAEDDYIVIKTDDIPPLWSVTQKESRVKEPHVEDSSDEDLIIVLIDLNRVRDCLEHLEPYINNHLKVVAFARRNFNGYGVTGELENDNYGSIFSDNNSESNVSLIWHLCKYCHQYANKKVHFIVVSKNTSLSYLPELVGDTRHKCTVVKDWSELRIYVE